MATETQETYRDIIAEMRIFKCCNLETGKLEPCSAIANYFADRLEAAFKREKAAIEADALAVGGILEAAHGREMATTEKSSAVGVAAKLREALEATNKFLESAITDGKVTARDITALRDIVSAARSEPVHNCDVGTAMEQGERFSAYCRAHKHPESECLLCPLFGQTGGHCELAWAQMPYEEGGTK